MLIGCSFFVSHFTAFTFFLRFLWMLYSPLWKSCINSALLYYYILICIMSVLADCITGRCQSHLLTQQSSSFSFAGSKQHILSPSLCLTPIITALRRVKWRGRLSCGLMLDSLACPIMLTYLYKPHVLLHTNRGPTSHVHTYLYMYTKETHTFPNRDKYMRTLRPHLFNHT